MSLCILKDGRFYIVRGRVVSDGWVVEREYIFGSEEEAVAFAATVRWTV